MKGKSALMAGVAAVALVASMQAGYAAKKTSDATSAPAAAVVPAGPTTSELAARIQALEDALQADEAKAQGDHTRLSTLEQNFDYAKWTFDNGRPVITSGDGRFSLAFRVRAQIDFASFLQDSPTASGNNAQYKDLSTGAVVRRGFFGVEGKAFNDFWYEFRYNAGGSNGGTNVSPTCTASSGTCTVSGVTVATGTEGDGVMSIARVAYLGIPHTRINVGIIEPAFGLEAATSSGQLMFLERPEIENIATDTFGGADGRRGIEVAYQYDNAFLPGDNFILTAAYTGNKTGSSVAHGNGGDEQSQFLSHLSYRFWSDGPSNAIIGADYATILGTGGSVNSYTLQDRPEIRVDGTRLVGATIGGGDFVSHHAFLVGGNAAANYENFYLGGEYIYYKTDRYNKVTGIYDHPDFSGYFAEASWVLTGEPKGYAVNATNNEIGGYGAPKVASPFSLNGDSWGAWELVARYSFTNLDWYRNTSTYGIAGGRQGIIDVGLNWYLNNEVKLQFHGSAVHVDKQKSVGNTSTATTQVGQDLNIIGIRLQFSN